MSPPDPTPVDPGTPDYVKAAALVSRAERAAARAESAAERADQAEARRAAAVARAAARNTTLMLFGRLPEPD